MSVLDDLASYLVANTTLTLGGTTGTLAIEQMLDTQPDSVMSLFEQPGIGNAYAFSTGNPIEVVYEQVGVQALSRSTSPTLARSRIQTTYRLLDGLSTTINGIKYLDIRAVQAPFQAGRDDNQRWLWSLNMDIKKTVDIGFDNGFDEGFG